jgi:hypothetical protein
LITRNGQNPTSATPASLYPGIKTSDDIYNAGFKHSSRGTLTFDFVDAQDKLNFQLDRWTKFLAAQGNVEQAKNALELARKDKDLKPEKLVEYEKAYTKATAALYAMGDPKTIKDGYVNMLQAIIDRYTDIAEGRSSVAGFSNWNKDTKVGNTTLGAMIEDLNKQKLEAQTALNTVVNGPSAIAAQEALIRKATESLDKYQASVQETGSAAKRASETIPALVAQLDAIGEAARRNAEAIRNFKGAPVGAPRAMGGPVGSDTLLTPTTAGEVIMNRQASQEFYPLLAAMNGQVSAGLSLGGSINVGDVNINLNSSGNSKVDARAIGMELRGLIRQGLLNLNS